MAEEVHAHLATDDVNLNIFTDVLTGLPVPSWQPLLPKESKETDDLKESVRLEAFLDFLSWTVLGSGVEHDKGAVPWASCLTNSQTES